MTSVVNGLDLFDDSVGLPQGIQKHDSLSKFFDSVLDGTADLTILNKQAAEEEFVPDEELLEIERKQEAQKIALAHGGFTELIDFEEAIKNGAGADFHAKNGYPGMMGGAPPKQSDAKAKEEEDPIRRILKAQQEAEQKEREKPKMAKTGEAGQVVFSAEETGHVKTPVAGATGTATPEPSTPGAESREAPVIEEEITQLEEAASEAATSASSEETKTAGHVTDEL